VEQEVDDQRTALDIIRQMGAAYSQFQSYEDSGYVASTFNPRTVEERVYKLMFVTAFKRPHFFKFEWSELDQLGDERTASIWCDGKHAYSNVLGNIELVKADSTGRALELAIARATGISKGASVNVASLLVDIDCNKITKAQAADLLADTIFEGQTCYAIGKKGSRNGRYATFLISKDDLVIRKVTEDYVLPPGNPFDTLKADAFKSIRGFLRWIKFRKYAPSGQTRTAPLPVHQEMVYSHVMINGEIPDSVFGVKAS
jgi:hypothetical protein